MITVPYWCVGVGRVFGFFLDVVYYLVWYILLLPVAVLHSWLSALGGDQERRSEYKSGNFPMIMCQVSCVFMWVLGFVYVLDYVEQHKLLP